MVKARPNPWTGADHELTRSRTIPMVDVKNPESPHLSLQVLIGLSSVEYVLVSFSSGGKFTINLQLLDTPPCEGKVFANSESHSGDNVCLRDIRHKLSICCYHC